MHKVTFVTSNGGKFHEAEDALAAAGIELERSNVKTVEIQADSLEEVAGSKVLQIASEVPTPFFVDDAGLFVDALSGFPGVYSAYASRTVGCGGILRLLDGKASRTARFEAAIAYLEEPVGHPRIIKGVCTGTIATDARGEKGFGFDPIFVPTGSALTFSEMDLGEKNRLSHRGKALRALAAHIAFGRRQAKV